MSEAIGRAVRTYRRARGLTQEEVARRAVTCSGTVSRIERGQPIARNSLVRIARALGVKLRDLERAAEGDANRTEGESSAA